MADPSGSSESTIPSDQPPVAVKADAEASIPTGIWERIKHHKILQWGLGYLGAAIAIAHGQELMAEAFDWPHLIGRILMSVLVAGLPIVLTLAWYHGHKGLKRIGSGETAIIALLILIAAGLLVVLVRVPNEHAATQTMPAAREGASSPAPNPATVLSGVSLAVLPFVDMSPEHNQDYFSDGLSEELLNQLAQIKDLRVTGRTSSFSFKGKNEDLRAIGEQLGVGNILEGSVRKDGNRLRITAQLINSRDGTHRWSQTYDRELSDVFAVQEEIAMAVSAALSVTLDVGELSRARGGTTNVDAYDKYLRAGKAHNRGVGRADMQEAAQLFRDAVALDPKFARAWSGLYNTLASMLIFAPENSVAARKEMLEASAHVVALAPNAWWTQAMRADQLVAQHRWVDAQTAASAAVAAAPVSDVEATRSFAIFLFAVGRARDAADAATRLRRTDPLSLDVSFVMQIGFYISGRPEEAEVEYERSKALAGDHTAISRFRMWRLMARTDSEQPAMKTKIRQLLQHSDSPLDRRVAQELDNADAARAEIRKQFNDPANQEASIIEGIAVDAAYLGDKDLVLAALRRKYVDLRATNIGLIWDPNYRELRTDPRFKDLLRDLGLAGYFRASGQWGDFCNPTGADDFECR